MGKKAEFTYRRSDCSPTYLEYLREYYPQMEYQPAIQYKNSSRYKNLRTLKDDVTGRIHHESSIQRVVQKSTDDEYVTITNETEGRLDMLALEYYGSARYWWILALANYIIDPFDVPVGTLIRIPPIISLYQSGGVLNG